MLKDLCIYTLRKTYVKKPYSVDGHFGGPVSEPRQEPLSHCQSIVCQAQESKKENKYYSSKKLIQKLKKFIGLSQALSCFFSL